MSRAVPLSSGKPKVAKRSLGGCHGDTLWEKLLEDRELSRFQVDLRGVIDLLSRHLYSSPGVFVREMLQNSVDAIQARRQADPQHSGAIEIEVLASRGAPPTLLFQDNGIGLTEEEVHRFLATIGQSSKRGGIAERPTDFIGQFGIGLLSCFMVTDQITVLTRSAKEGDQPAIEWRGSTDGTYSVRTLSEEIPVGTQVYLRAAAGAEEYFAAEQVETLARQYGGFLNPSITITRGGQRTQINSVPPWDEVSGGRIGRERLVDYARSTFDREFLDVIPLKSVAGGVEGVAFVLAQAVHAGTKQRHRVYLKNMLLSTESDDLLPEWAFFVQCVLNAHDLRPTASREAFYDDATLGQAREELGGCLRRYLIDMARREPDRFQQLMSVHHLAAKSLAIDDDECLELFADWFPFETTLGTMTLGEFRQRHPVVRYVPSRDEFRQIAQVAASESVAVINAGYVYDVEVLERLGALRPDLQIEPFDSDQLSDRFEELTHEERAQTIDFERQADVTLQRFKCGVEVVKFRPVDLPALYVASGNSAFLRSIEQTQEVTEGVWSDVLGSLGQDLPATYARLYLNYANPLVRRICQLDNQVGQRRCLEMVYIQSLLLGHFPLGRDELKLLNDGLLGLIDWALAGENRDGGE